MTSRCFVAAAVFHSVLVDVPVVECLGVAGRSAGDEPFMPFSHQPLGGVGGHVPAHVLLQPSV